MSDTVLILGATGRFGRHAAEAFWNAGWRVRLFDRANDSLATAAAGANVIVNGWNPDYPNWSRDIPRLTAEVIEAAKMTGATVLLPGNVYCYGPGSGPVLGLETPMRAQNPLGRIRIEMEAAYRASGVPTILLRAGDFIDTAASGNWFDKIIAAKAARGRFVAPGDADAAHSWAYLPDLARATVALAKKRDTLAVFEEVLYDGYTLSINQLAELAGSALGHP